MDQFDDFSNEDSLTKCSCEIIKGLKLELDSEGTLMVMIRDSEIPFWSLYFDREGSFKKLIDSVFHELPPCMQSLISKLNNELQPQTYSYSPGLNYVASAN